jgi:hypothetical protein
MRVYAPIHGCAYFASLRATSADYVDLAPPATFVRGHCGAVIFGGAHQPYRIQPTKRVPTGGARSYPNFGVKRLP